MLRTVKPKNARAKRALDARAPKEVEDERTTIFVRGTKTGDMAGGAMQDLMALKRPNAISFSKKNVIRPFDSSTSSSASAYTSTASLEFWSNKNDASLFVIGQSTKKRPNGLTFVRMYDGKVLDMVEIGVTSYESMTSIKGPKSTPGHKPLLHFASELFDTHPRYIQLKSMFMSFFNGEEIESICLSGLESVISISCAPSTGKEDELPSVHLRAFTTRLLASGSRVPRIELNPMGPSIDFELRRDQPADTELWKQAMRRPKLKQKDVEKGLGKKRKNMEVDEMGDLRGKIHLGKQDLSKLKGRVMKGLRDPVEGPKKKRKTEDSDEDDE